MKWEHIMQIDEIDDNELIAHLGENDETIKDLVFAKYGYVIDYVLRKYTRVMNIFNVDEQEARCEGMYGFSDGMNSYVDGKNTKLKTFLELCVERRITNYINKYTTNKAKMLKDTLSIDYYSEENGSFIEAIGDDNKFNPLNSVTYNETFEELLDIAKDKLSEFEYKVFTYFINDIKYVEIAKILGKTPKQIDNSIQRIRSKLKQALKENKIEF